MTDITINTIFWIVFGIMFVSSAALILYRVLNVAFLLYLITTPEGVRSLEENPITTLVWNAMASFFPMNYLWGLYEKWKDTK